MEKKTLEKDGEHGEQKKEEYRHIGAWFGIIAGIIEVVFIAVQYMRFL